MQGVDLVTVQEPDQQADRHPVAWHPQATLGGGLLAEAHRRFAGAAQRERQPEHVCGKRGRCTGDVAANAVDADASTRYSTGVGQAPGQYLLVDFGRPVDARRVVFDTGVSTGDYPRGYTVATSTDGAHWNTVVAGQGTGQFTTADLSGAPAVRP